MRQLIYYSRALLSPRTKLEQLRDILSRSRRNNARDELSGYLLFTSEWFVQVIEGEPSRVQTAYNRIQLDKRHSTPKLIFDRNISARSFAEWSMGAAVRSLENEDVFLRYGVSDVLDPAVLTPSLILMLALELQSAADLRQARALIRRPAA